MARIFPETPRFSDPSEGFVYDYIKNNLPDNYVSYFNYYIDIREFDFAVLVPSHGIMIIEVKGWKPGRVIKVKDNARILYGGQGMPIIPMPSPLKQANDYRYALADMLKKELGKTFMVLSMVCYPNISKAEYIAKELNKVSPEVCTLLKDDFLNHDGLEIKLRKLFNLGKDTLRLNAAELNEENIKIIRNVFEVKEEIALGGGDNLMDSFGFEKEENGEDSLASCFEFY